jgi:hypothetical protein
MCRARTRSKRACWYINMGVINKEFCTTMVQAALTAKLWGARIEEGNSKDPRHLEDPRTSFPCCRIRRPVPGSHRGLRRPRIRRSGSPRGSHPITSVAFSDNACLFLRQERHTIGGTRRQTNRSAAYGRNSAMPPNASMNPSRLTNEATGRIRSPDRHGDLVRLTLHPQAAANSQDEAPRWCPTTGGPGSHWFAR